MSLAGVFAAALCAFAVPARATESYAVEIEGVSNGLRGALENVSVIAGHKREIATTAALRRIARNDLENFRTTLQAAGYYAGTATVEVDAETDPEKPKVIFRVETGPKFRITDYEIRYVDEDGSDRPASLDAAGMKANGAADGASLQQTQLAFLNALWDKGYPSARIISREAVADLEAGTARAVFVFASGQHARFGEIKVSGQDRTSPVYLRKLKTWRPGDIYSHSKLVAYRDRLAATGLFSSIDVEPGAPDTQGLAPVLVNVAERKRRTIGVGASYSTTEGPGGRLYFDYRNLFHHGELAHTEISGTQVQQSIGVTLDKPLPAMPGSAFATFQFSNESPDAYHARTIRLSGGLSHKWLQSRLETRGALALETSKVRTDTSDVRTYFFSIPLTTIWNTENDLLNPTQGVKVSLSATPYTGSDSFEVSELNVRSRFTFGKHDRFTIAYRGRLGSIVGSPLSSIASNKRFYAGGGASVRGYGYQLIGPLDAENNPVGGRSVIEGAIETRALVTRKIQVAAFADTGSISESSTPDFGQRFFIGVGGGVRYLTPVGPIRLDVAFPTDRRAVDNAFQIYISLGQAF
ncbi:MAG: BamA/TamA family outer membrane protein [Alphaproteobacteria bacterium]|nr:BamA/TamA family outer membrane protein [Alphaproteobacteria bacterium]